MNEQSFDDAVSRICERNGDYDAEAYYFLREGLDATVRRLGREDSGNRHVTGRELCEGLRDYALEEWGPLALLVLTQWGVYETSDFGNLVFELVSEGVFGKRGSDKREDFDGVFSFEDAFQAPYEPPPAQPRARSRRAAAASRRSSAAKCSAC
ncbi:MAG: hypothetical protein IJ783_11110 [Kiritimatiellae bacterium]|nr:hypothetical protein [Kiritimatiellia bacterium]